MKAPINYHGCTLFTSGPTNCDAIVSPKGKRYEYRHEKRLGPCGYDLTGRIEIITGPTSAVSCGSMSDACQYVAERDV